MVRFLELIRPVMCVLPEVATPDRKIPFREKALCVCAFQRAQRLADLWASCVFSWSGP